MPHVHQEPRHRICWPRTLCLRDPRSVGHGHSKLLVLLNESLGSLDESISLKRPAPRSENRGAISHVAVDHDAKHLVTIGIEDKSLIVWDLSHLSLLSSR